MLVLDQQRIDRNKTGEAQEAYADRVNSWTMEQLSSNRVIEDVDLSPANPKRQLGTMLENPIKLERILQSYCPNLVVTQVDQKKVLDFVKPDGSSIRACVYGAGPMPEWSMMIARREWEPDPDYALGKRTLERSEVRGAPVSVQQAYDMIKELGPSGAKDELLKRREGTGLNDTEYRPGFRRTLKIGREAVRGWRTVIAYVLQKNMITLPQAQQAVRILGGTEDRAAWAQKLGQRNDIVSQL